MKPQEWLAIIIVLLPIAIFLFAMLIILSRLRHQNIPLADLLRETDVVLKNADDRAQQAKTPKSSGEENSTNDTEPVVKHSSSRLILFISGITSVVLAVCFSSFYFYICIYNPGYAETMKFSAFTQTLLALGIGVVPYAANQLKKVRL